MKITTTTPTGNIGSKLAIRLLDAGAELTVIARDPTKVAALAGRGARVVTGSQADPAVVTEATRGADALFWLTPPDYTAADFRKYQRQMGGAAAAAIRETGVARVVDLSSIGAQLPSGVGAISGLHDVEELINAAAKNVVLLRCGFFMENFLGLAQPVKNMGKLFMPIPPEVPMPMVATTDIAEVAARWLLDASWTGHRVTGAHGPADLPMTEVARVLSRVLGKPIDYVQISVDQAMAVMGVGMSESALASVHEMYSAMAEGKVRPSEARSPETTTTTTFEQFARDVFSPLYQKA
jgi:uncharacterized protein YbjT (DUF2867 family)